jgi:type I pantothenate kinase
VAEVIAEELSSRGFVVRVISTDAFLLSNAALVERDLIMRKGFPETYDHGAIAEVLGRLKRRQRAVVRMYSHAIYDIVAGATAILEPADIVVIEGVIALQSSVRKHLDVAIYVDADEEVVRRWFVERFLHFTDTARNDEASFYHRFAQLDPAQVRQLAEGTWDGINGVNLHEHIAPSKEDAQIIISKGPDHAIVRVEERGA